MGAPGEPEPVQLPVNQLNSLSFHPPSLSLVVRGTSRYHGFGGRKLKRPEGMAAAPGGPNPRVLVIGPNTNVVPNKPAVDAKPADVVAKGPKPAAPTVVAAGPVEPGGKPTLTDPKTNAQKVLNRVDRGDPKKMWQQAIAWGVDNPGLVVACADFLMDNDEPGHAAEILKASLRKGLATSSWAHDALAVALQASGAGPAEAERAAVSGIDLDPNDPKALLKAAKAESEQKNFAQAFAFCERSAELAPDAPGAYANALAYAEQATDVKADVVQWATGNLLRRDWAADGIDYHKEAKERAEKIAQRIETAGAKDAAAPIRKLVAEVAQRDLEVQVNWTGVADLSLAVTEPSGSVCSAGHKRTAGGGVLRTAFDRVADKPGVDAPDARGQVYTAARAFSGTYTLDVGTVFGRTADGTAQVVVTKFKGTPQQQQDIFTVDLSNPKPIEVKLDGGSRAELATVIEEVDEARLATTAAPLNGGRTGFASGVGRSGSGAGAKTSVTPSLPVVLPGASESMLPRVTDGAADVRTAMKVNPDRRTMTVTVTPAFAGAGRPVPMPTVPYLPGGEK
jgi:tetratricopeptide (TPR) repeat protein